MITKLAHVFLYTDDQEKIKQFYVEKLGLKVHTDVMFGEERWLTLCTEGDADFELTIIKAVDPSAQAFIGKQAAHNVPFLVFATDDCQGDFERLKAAGVQFVKEPTKESWGTDALLLDPVGNLIDIVQSTQK